ncbi:MAG TPA: hypothetical protein VHS31_10385 [Tepidisphaeraceae bacterium]|jgi:hypothetical protein|nr:hypothetical protein [Tepidisphaeraceae bacterium]
MLATTVLDLMRFRDPHSPRWNTQLPIFLAGGGSRLAVYRAAINEMSKIMKANYRSDINVLALSKPRQLEGGTDITDENFHRLAVAWGLSYPETDIGQVTRPTDIEDVPHARSGSNWQDHFVSKDHV